MLARLFGRSFTDFPSDYPAFARRFVKSFSSLSAGSEISVHALKLKIMRLDRSAVFRAANAACLAARHLWRQLPDPLTIAT